jgi:hypothetical protein
VESGGWGVARRSYFDPERVCVRRDLCFFAFPTVPFPNVRLPDVGPGAGGWTLQHPFNKH